MFKVKTSGWFLALLVVLALLAYGDFELSRSAENDLRVALSTHDIAGGMASRVKVGMDRATAEGFIAGFRQISLFEANDELTVIYSYWFGVLPPLPSVLRYKVHAKVSVTYDAAGAVLEVRHWYS